MLETFTDLDEAELALSAVAGAVSIPFGISCTFRGHPNALTTLTGGAPSALVRLAVAKAAAFVGANCGAGLDGFETLAGQLLESPLPVWLAPSAGLPQAGPFGLHEREAFAALGSRLAARGAAVFGGCCGTDPSFIRALRARLERRTAEAPP
jgi:methionine synthase I (cobalamin-dependent)